MWNAERSLLLSKLLTLIFCIGLVVVLLVAPSLVLWLIAYSINATEEMYPYFLVTVYSGGVVAGALLFTLYRLLQTIGKGEVFSRRNVTSLRIISWCCLLGAGICLVSIFYYLPWVIVALAASLMGLIVRVVKNIVAQAVILKEENDFTI